MPNETLMLKYLQISLYKFIAQILHQRLWQKKNLPTKNWKSV